MSTKQDAVEKLKTIIRFHAPEWEYVPGRRKGGRRDDTGFNRACDTISEQLAHNGKAWGIDHIRGSVSGKKAMGKDLCKAIAALHDTMFHVKHKPAKMFVKRKARKPVKKRVKRTPKKRNRRTLNWKQAGDLARVNKLSAAECSEILLAAAIERGY